MDFELVNNYYTLWFEIGWLSRCFLWRQINLAKKTCQKNLKSEPNSSVSQSKVYVSVLQFYKPILLVRLIISFKNEPTEPITPLSLTLLKSHFHLYWKPSPHNLYHSNRSWRWLEDERWGWNMVAWLHLFFFITISLWKFDNKTRVFQQLYP